MSAVISILNILLREAGRCWGTTVPYFPGEQASSDALQVSPELWLLFLGAAGSGWVQLKPEVLLLLPQVFESSNQSSYNESTGKDLLPRKRRRSRIPDKPNYSLNLWSIMKNCIGKELSKIPMPVSTEAASGWARGTPQPPFFWFF